MTAEQSRVGEQVVVERRDLQKLLDALAGKSDRVIGPTVRDRVITYDDVAAVEDLPIGWTDEQDAGTYRLRRRDDEAVFGYVVGQRSWKNFLYPSVVRLWEAQRTTSGFRVLPEKRENPRLALLGVRACDLHAIQIQDRVLIEGERADPAYADRRARVLLVAVNCVEAHRTCFCASMGTGPRATAGFDLALTELLEAGRHYFVVDVGSGEGAEILGTVPFRRAGAEEVEAAERRTAGAAANMGRSMDTSALKELLYASYEHGRWEEVARRCLMCGNCTMVCPTCFCTTVADVTDLGGKRAERWRRLDSCFTLDFSYIHGGSVRVSPCSRYRQWLVHKLAAWIDQFGTSGCVGCGRCITWCPVGIDMTEEVEAIRGVGGTPAGVASSKELNDADA